MLPRTLIVGVVGALAATGCGHSERAAGTRTPSATPTPAPQLTRARSVRECARLWNEDALPLDNPQVSANEFVAELAPVRVHVAYQRGNCFVVAPIGGRRIAIFAAPDGRRPFTIPTRRRLKSTERVLYNARADHDGRVVLDA
jgi:hypothetical protein